MDLEECRHLDWLKEELNSQAWRTESKSSAGRTRNSQARLTLQKCPSICRGVGPFIPTYLIVVHLPHHGWGLNLGLGSFLRLWEISRKQLICVLSEASTLGS